MRSYLPRRRIYWDNWRALFSSSASEEVIIGILSFISGSRIKINIIVSSFQAVGHLNIFSLNYFFRVRVSIVDLLHGIPTVIYLKKKTFSVCVFLPLTNFVLILHTGNSRGDEETRS